MATRCGDGDGRFRRYRRAPRRQRVDPRQHGLRLARSGCGRPPSWNARAGAGFAPPTPRGRAVRTAVLTGRSDGQQARRLLGEPAAVQRQLQRRLEHRRHRGRPALVAEHRRRLRSAARRAACPADARHSATIALPISSGATCSIGRSVLDICRRNPSHESGDDALGPQVAVHHRRRRQRRQQRVLAAPRSTRFSPNAPTVSLASRSTWIGPSALIPAVSTRRTDPRRLRRRQLVEHRLLAGRLRDPRHERRLAVQRRRPGRLRGRRGLAAAGRGGEPAPPPTPSPTTRSAATPLNDSSAAVGSGDRLGDRRRSAPRRPRPPAGRARRRRSASHDGSHTRSTTGQRSISPSTSTGRPSRSPTVPRRAHAGPSSSTAITGVSGSTVETTDRSTLKSDSPTSVRTTSPRSRSAAAISSRCRSTTDVERASRGSTSVPCAAMSR